MSIGIISHIVFLKAHSLLIKSALLKTQFLIYIFLYDKFFKIHFQTIYHLVLVNKVTNDLFGKRHVQKIVMDS
jgi:hypothetical protein